MPIHAEFGADGALKRVSAVSESASAREQTNQALNAAKRQGTAISHNALASPLLSHQWNGKRAALAGILPLTTVLVASVVFQSNVVSAVRTFRNLDGR